MMNFVLKNDEFCIKMMNIVFKNDEYCHKGGCHYYDNITQSSLAAAGRNGPR